MESGTAGANAVVPFFAHLTLYHLNFSTVRQSTNTQNLGSANANWSSESVLHGAFNSSDDVGNSVKWTSVQNNQQVLSIDLASATLKTALLMHSLVFKAQ